jgi:hypothetical protein
VYFVSTGRALEDRKPIAIWTAGIVCVNPLELLKDNLCILARHMFVSLGPHHMTALQA